jgi:hypothetical protein
LFSEGHKGLRVHAQLKLADLQVYQGKLEAAEILLAGYEDYPSALIPLARLHFAKGELARARAVLEQALTSADRESPGIAPLLVLLIQVLLAAGSAQEAHEVANSLTALAQSTVRSSGGWATGMPYPISNLRSISCRITPNRCWRAALVWKWHIR